MVATSQGSRHGLKGKDYRVPKKWMLLWWKLGCKLLGVKIKFSTNEGLGLFNRYGRQLPDYSHLASVGGIRKKRSPGPYLCLKPLASIYLVRRRGTSRKGHSQWLTRLTSLKSFRCVCPEGTRKELAEIAKRRYQSTCAFARQAIMKELELAREKDGYCLLPDGDNKAA
jgi:hypothetical protein